MRKEALEIERLAIRKHGEWKRLGCYLATIDATVGKLRLRKTDVASVLVCHVKPLDRDGRWRQEAADVLDEGFHRLDGEVDVRDQDFCIDARQLQPQQVSSSGRQLVEENGRFGVGGIARGVQQHLQQVLEIGRRAGDGAGSSSRTSWRARHVPPPPGPSLRGGRVGGDTGLVPIPAPTESIA
ncbi:hypothetical protein J3459_006651 [Metarhizium acridum]|nr:hypothetical protein J3459_006651 [Metarhizium acridum]